MRLLHQVGTVGSARSDTGLLHSGIDRKRRAAGESGDVQELPASSKSSSQRTQKADMIERQHLDQTKAE